MLVFVLSLSTDMKLPYYLQRMDAEDFMDLWRKGLLMDAEDFVDLCRKGLLVDVRTALDNGADVNQVGYDGRTGLMEALWEGHNDVAEVLLQHPEVDVNKVSNNGSSALYSTVWEDNHEMTAVLLAREDLTRATINSRHTLTNLSPIMYAIAMNSVRCLPLLLACTKVDLDVRDKYQRSPQGVKT